MRVITSSGKGARDRRRARRYQHRYARRHGYFWLPCPLCGDEFGGHEAHGMLLLVQGTPFDAICPDCTAERQFQAESRLQELGKRADLTCTRWGFDGAIGHHIPHKPQPA